jgi:hypothetical protein
MRFRSSKVGVAFVVALAALAPHSAGARPPDPAERGLDLFVHTAKAAISGDTVALDLRAYGFPSVAKAEVLAGATVVAAWDPESLGPGVSSVPPDVTTTTGRLGEARVDVPVPAGDARTLTLLLSVRHGEHVRTRAVQIARKPSSYVELRVAETHVVPGSRVPAWITVTDARGGHPIAGATVDVALLEGQVARRTERLTTDASGLGRASFTIPEGAT